MRNARARLTPLLLALSTLGLAPGAAAPIGDTVRVRLQEGPGPYELRPDHPGALTDLDSGERLALEAGKTYVVRALPGGGLKVGDRVLGARLRWGASGADGLVALEGRRYRGSLLLERTRDEQIRAVNELGIEDYLYSVLPGEMSPEWPMETLKAQAVISRTYALKNLGKYEEDGYDLLDDVRSQVYRGVDSEDERARRAVDETAGQILAYKGRLISTHFHSCCGGHTRSVQRAFGGKAMRIKPLAGVPDGFCAASPHFRWTRRVPSSAILAALPKNGRTPALLKKVSVYSREGSGWTRTLEVATDAGTVRVSAADLRRFVGPDLLRSTNLTKISVDGKNVKFSGKGWGHGVGLCQWGSRLQAKKGRKYANILKFYYPGAKVVTWRSWN